MRMKDRLQRRGFNDIKYIIVNMKKSIHHINILENIVDFRVNQDKTGEIWKMLSGIKDDFYIYDRCGRLAQFVPYAMSYLGRNYVRDAIIKTYRGQHRCGKCLNGTAVAKPTMPKHTQPHRLPLTRKPRPQPRPYQPSRRVVPRPRPRPRPRPQPRPRPRPVQPRIPPTKLRRPCKDKIIYAKYCNYWNLGGFCTRKYGFISGFMVKNCRRTCRFCEA